MIAVLAILDILYFIVLCCRYANIDSELIIIGPALGFLTGMYVVRGYFLLKDILLEEFIISTVRRTEEMYFHGFKLWRYINSGAFLRLEDWLKTGMCYELSVLAMVLMKNNKSARLCRGYYSHKDGQFKTRHAWVEVKVPLNGKVVIDFAWMSPGFCRKKVYLEHCNKNGNLTREWVCTYDDFWKIRFSNLVSEAMKKRETSHVLLELSAFGDPDQGYDFGDWIYGLGKFRFSNGEEMVSHHRNDSDKPISTRIIQDFLKNPKRKNPKAKSIRLAQMEVHGYGL